MKFSKQRTLSECGPRAIHNALIYLNRKMAPMERLRKECETDRYGSEDYPVYRTIRKYFNSKRVKLSNLFKIPDGSAAVVGYDRKETGNIHSGHYVLVIKDDSNSYRVINHIPHKYFNVVDKGSMHYFKTEVRMSAKGLKKFLKPPVIDGLRQDPLIFVLK